jgi:ABC-type sugar transport system substrate-binding protein
MKGGGSVRLYVVPYLLYIDIIIVFKNFEEVRILKKRMKKIVAVTIAVFMVAVSCMGCNNASTTSSTNTTPDASVAAGSQAAPAKTIKIGCAISTMTMTWPQYAVKAMQAEAKTEGIDLIISDSGNDVEKQASVIENFITQKVDGIITNPINVTSLANALAEADKAGIPVAVFDRQATNSPYACFVGSDDVKAGAMAADLINEKLNGKGSVVEIIGANGASPSIDRHQGFTDEMKKYPGLKVVFSQSGQFVRETGMTVMEEAINKTHSQFDAVYAANDDMMMGALQAMQASNIDLSKVFTISNDGIPDALTAIDKGTLDATIQYPVAMAPDALKTLTEFITTKQAPPAKDQKIQPFTVDKSNLSGADFFAELKK